MCFAYAYADYKECSVNLFATAAERDEAVRELLDNGGDDNPFPPNATAEEAWAAFCNTDTPDFFLAFNEM